MPFLFFILLLVFSGGALRAQESFDILEIERLQLEKEIADYPLASLPEEERYKKIREFDTRKQLLAERNNLLPVRIPTRYYKVYTTDGSIAYQHTQFADEVYNRYRELFPDYTFAGKHPVHFLIYPDRAAYLKYEGMDPRVAGHALSRQTTARDLAAVGPGIAGFTKISPETQIQRLAFYLPAAQDMDQKIFTHELAHIFTWDMLNEKRTVPRSPNLFLNEGLSEYFASQGNPDLFAKKLNPLRDMRRSSWPLSWLGASTYPAPVHIASFYAEALLFVSWLAEQPQAGPRLRALLEVSSDQEAMEVVKKLSLEKSVPPINWSDYAPYRQSRLSHP
jgi:hypothetical protein